MRPGTIDLLRAARDGQPLPREALRSFIAAIADRSLPDYQASAFLMAVYQKGLSAADTTALTLAMRDSGHCIDLGHLPQAKVDKHSTGGVGDKVSLALAPWVATCGLVVPMVAGRGLGQTGGTLDKLESIPGMHVDLSLDNFMAALNRHHVAIIGQTQSMAPADRILYALRDVTATIESIPLITASILSKKLSEGIGALVLDVKVGRGAFMPDIASARVLAHSLIRVGEQAGVRVRVLLTRMEAPLGLAIGNALEVEEAIAVLEGRGPKDTTELTLALGAEMLVMGKVAASLAEAVVQMEAARTNGSAKERFVAMVEQQGGKLGRPTSLAEVLPKAPYQTTFKASVSGYISGLDALALGQLAMVLGAGRSRAEDPIDPAVGLILHHQVGDKIEAESTWITVHHTAPLVSEWKKSLELALSVHPTPIDQIPLVIERL